MTILDEIVAAKRHEIAAAKAKLPESELCRQLAKVPLVRDFFAALSKPGPMPCY
jgi:indole-3-glycerol phosphate synthase